MDCKVEFLKLWKAVRSITAFLLELVPARCPDAVTEVLGRRDVVVRKQSEFSRKGNTQVSSKHVRNLSLAIFWTSGFSFLSASHPAEMVKLTIVVNFYGPTIIKSIIFGCCPFKLLFRQLVLYLRCCVSTYPCCSSHAVDILHSVHSSQLDRKLVLLRALLTGPQRTLHSYKKG